LSKDVAAARKIESEVVKSVQAETEALANKKKSRDLNDLTTIIEAAGFQLNAEMRKALTFLDAECIRPYVDQTTYQSILSDFRDILEERF